MATLTHSFVDKIKAFEQQYDQIPDERKVVLDGIASQFLQYIQSRGAEEAQLIFVCTHNSRRSHISQIWAQATALHFGFHTVTTYSGGTEGTAFFPSAVQAMKNMGFSIEKTNDAANPNYEITYAGYEKKTQAFSKVFDDASNPQDNFIAVMTCSHADENCPFIPGAEKRIPLLYEDPKAFDGTPIAQQKYNEKAEEIGRELTYIFSLMKTL